LVSDRYAVERTHATARDGTRVPVTVICRKDVPRDGTAPALLYGYGAYGAPMEASYDPWRLSVLDRGVICALAHVRGGGDLGKRWHEDGKTLTKLNSVTDFIAVAEDLIARGYTSPDRLAIQSLSAGGVLIGGAINLRPDLFRAAVLQGPFLDVVNSMLDPTLPLTVPEYLEWGDPRIKIEYNNMKAYCPYTNLSSHTYPAMLLMTSLNDSQVMCWEPIKYVAKVRALKTDAHPVLLRVSENAGHTGASGRDDVLREKAFTYAFLLSEIGIGRSARP
jgi:oligopeptidase B